MWEFAVISLICAVLSFVSAFFPHWPVRWGSGRSGRKGTPMSIGGRIATGFLFAYTCGMALIRKSNFLTVTIYLLIFLWGTLVYLRDRRNHNNATRLDEEKGTAVID
jgi:hypothetical protein